MEDPPPLVRFRTFLEYPLSPPPTERTYLLNGPKKLSIFISILCLTPPHQKKPKKNNIKKHCA